MASPTLSFPPLDCSLLFPDLVDFHMERNPTFPVFVYANANVPDTLTEISFLEFGRATHRIAHALRPSRKGSDGEVVMIIAHTDTILYNAVTVGLSIAGCVPFPVSPRNSAPAIVHMMKKTSCSRIISLDHAHKGLIDAIRREFGDGQLTISELPSLHYAFPKLGKEVSVDPFDPYPPAPKRPDLDSPAIYLHSSGSTGFPKPISHSYRTQIQWFTRRSSSGYLTYPAPRRVAAMALPPFHVFGVFSTVYVPIAYLVTAVVYAPRTEHDPFAQPVIPTSDNMIECLKRVRSNSLMTVPSLLEPMADSEEAVEILKKLNFVCFGGGPLPIKVGEKMWAAGVELVCGLGGTEFGVLALKAHKQDAGSHPWMWMHFEDVPKLRWVPLGDETYEMHVLSTRDQYMSVENLSDVKGYATSDVFVKHPTKDLWRIVGRVDDVIMLASGEKTVPGPIENVIASSPFVQGVVMFGRERNQVGVLIEPSAHLALDIEDENAVSEFKNRIWPVIEEANRSSPTFSRIFKEMVLITNSDKPMLRAAKGTVQRKATLNAYETEINALYEVIEGSSVDDSAGPSGWTSEALEQWLLAHARVISPDGRTDSPVDPSADLFAQGFDSLSATYLRNRILGALRMSPDPHINNAADSVPPNIVFENPTIKRLSYWLATLVNGHVVGQVQDVVEQHKQAINAMIEKYSVGLDGPEDGVLPSSVSSIEPAVVVLTGSTGGLGSFLLCKLLKSPRVQRVYAFNRPSSSKAIRKRQSCAFRDRGLPIEMLDSNKLVYIEADASLEKCGLSAAQYEEIRSSVTLIIHNAWRLDFNLALSSFEDSIRASRNLVDLGLNSCQRQHLRFLFTSTIGSAQSWDISKGPFPEAVQFDPSIAVGAGYGEGKYVTERMIVKSGLHATSLRIGQIAGGHHGSWATTDWFPILVKSSIALGVLPGYTGVVSWIRQEDVACTMLELAFAEEASPPALNVFNPCNVPWGDVMGSVRRSVIKRKRFAKNVLPIVPFREWFALLEKRAENASEDELREIPAIKLLEFFRELARRERENENLGGSVEAGGMATLDTTKIRRMSQTMASMRPIGEAEADAWVSYWISKSAL